MDFGEEYVVTDSNTSYFGEVVRLVQISISGEFEFCTCRDSEGHLFQIRPEFLIPIEDCK